MKPITSPIKNSPTSDLNISQLFKNLIADFKYLFHHERDPISSAARIYQVEIPRESKSCSQLPLYFIQDWNQIILTSAANKSSTTQSAEQTLESGTQIGPANQQASVYDLALTPRKFWILLREHPQNGA